MVRLTVILVGIAVMATVAWHKVSGQSLPQFAQSDPESITGVFHVHSAASHDSDTPLSTIALAARNLNLDFVIVTDHNQQAQPAREIDNVHFLFFPELSTAFGHLIQLGGEGNLSQDQRKSTEAQKDLIELGADPIIAHPTRARRPWDGPWYPVGGIEIVNSAASILRRAGPFFVGIIPDLAIWLPNPTLALAQSYDRDVVALRRWDDYTDPTVAGLCGVDAHDWIDTEQNLRLWHIALGLHLPADTGTRLKTIEAALKQGRFHCYAGLLGERPHFRFTARASAGEPGEPGSIMTETDIEALEISTTAIQTNDGLVDPTIILLRNGYEVQRTIGTTSTYNQPIPGGYRVEIRAPIPKAGWGHRMAPIIYSNKIQVVTAPSMHSTSEP